MVAGADIVFRAKGLTKVYRIGELEVHALRGVDFQASRGEFIVILGPSGSGKSTFLNIVGGLDAATAGEAWFEDHQLTALDERGLTQYRRDHVGFVFQ
ncbi:MAG: ATP-binding cassette domain-containing protein, partial [Cypionkella sp.]|nr:ATP-binding cassette domain-containing protein [Cypionkella sp.]